MSIYKVGYTRAGRLDVFACALPSDAPPVNELRLDEMVCDDHDPGPCCLVFKPLRNDYYLLVCARRGKRDRAAPIVAGRLLPRDAAEELMRCPDRLLRLGQLLQSESAENVAHYRDAVPDDDAELHELPPLDERWMTVNASEDEVRLILLGLLNAARSQKKPIQFLNASGAALHRALTLAPTAVSLECGFSFPFNASAGAVAELCICSDDDAADLFRSRGQGWPFRQRVFLANGNDLGQELALAVEVLMNWNSSDRSRWDDLYGGYSALRTQRLLTALGAVHQAEKKMEAVAALMSMGWSESDAAAAFQALTPYLGAELPSSEPEEAENKALPPAQEAENKVLPPAQEASGPREVPVFRLLSAMGVLAALIAATLVLFYRFEWGLLHRTIHITMELGAGVLLLLGAAFGVLLEKLAQALEKRFKC